MPRLVLLRHAKSDYPDGVPDHERPLAERGVREALLAGAWIHDNVGRVDRVVVSSATRTLQTLELVDTELDFDGPVTVDPRVYDALPQTLLDITRELPAATVTCVLVGHNPGIELLAQALTQPDASGRREAMAAKYPTSAIAVIDSASDWGSWTTGCARLTEFHVPR